MGQHLPAQAEQKNDDDLDVGKVGPIDFGDEGPPLVPETTSVVLVQREGHSTVRVFEHPQLGAQVVAEIPSHSEADLFVGEYEPSKLFCRVWWHNIEGWVGVKNVVQVSGQIAANETATNFHTNSPSSGTWTHTNQTLLGQRKALKTNYFENVDYGEAEPSEDGDGHPVVPETKPVFLVHRDGHITVRVLEHPQLGARVVGEIPSYSEADLFVDDFEPSKLFCRVWWRDIEGWVGIENVREKLSGHTYASTDAASEGPSIRSPSGGMGTWPCGPPKAQFFEDVNDGGAASSEESQHHSLVAETKAVTLVQSEGLPKVRVLQHPQLDARMVGEIPSHSEADLFVNESEPSKLFCKVWWHDIEGWVGVKNVAEKLSRHEDVLHTGTSASAAGGSFKVMQSKPAPVQRRPRKELFLESIDSGDTEFSASEEDDGHPLLAETKPVVLVQRDGRVAVHVFQHPQRGAHVVGEIPSHSEADLFVDDFEPSKLFCRVWWRDIKGWVRIENVREQLSRQTGSLADQMATGPFVRSQSGQTSASTNSAFKGPSIGSPSGGMGTRLFSPRRKVFSDDVNGDGAAPSEGVRRHSLVAETKPVILVHRKGRPTVRMFEHPQLGASVLGEIPSHSEADQFVDEYEPLKLFCKVWWRDIEGWVGVKHVRDKLSGHTSTLVNAAAGPLTKALFAGRGRHMGQPIPGQGAPLQPSEDGGAQPTAVDGGVKPSESLMKPVILVQREGHPSVRVYKYPRPDAYIVGVIPSQSEAVCLTHEAETSKSYCKVKWRDIEGWVGMKNVRENLSRPTSPKRSASPVSAKRQISPVSPKRQISPASPKRQGFVDVAETRHVMRSPSAAVRNAFLSSEPKRLHDPRHQLKRAESPKKASGTQQQLERAEDSKKARGARKQMEQAEDSKAKGNHMGYTALELREAGFTLKELKQAGYSAVDLQEAGFSVQELKAKYTLKELESENVPASELKALSYDAKQLKKAGYTLKSLAAAGFTMQQAVEAGYTFKQFKEAGCTLKEINQSCNVEMLKAAGFAAWKLRREGCMCMELKEAQYPLDDLKVAGYTLHQLKNAGYTWLELGNVGFPAFELLHAGCSASDLKEAYPDHTLKELRKRGCAAFELKRAGYTIDEMHDGGYTARELKEAMYKPDDLKSHGYTAAELKDAGFSLPDKFWQFKDEDLLHAGYTSKTLQLEKRIFWHEKRNDRNELKKMETRENLE